MAVADGAKISMPPYCLNVFLTEDCNLSCSYCYIPKKPHQEEKTYPSRVIIRAIKSLIKTGCKLRNINFTGGEPLLKFNDIKKIYNAFKDRDLTKGCSFTITTNGTLLNRKVLSFIEKHKLGLTVSIDGNKKTNDLNRAPGIIGEDAGYDCVIRNLINSKLPLKANLVFSQKNFRSLPENLLHLKKLGFVSIDFWPQLFAKWTLKEITELKESFRLVEQIFSGHCSNKRVGNYLLDSIKNGEKSYKPLMCNKISLDQNGTFYCCDRVFSLKESQRKKFIIGNAKNGVDERLRKKMLDRIRMSLWRSSGKDCRVCRYAAHCFCPVGHYIYYVSNGLDFKAFFPHFCRISKLYAKFSKTALNFRAN